ncbi:LANO_0B05292g1_1 [Lachancea nothofagi CBS 11611]|uniref:Pre-rRNA-processing protein n=1 Tax=Lachancea nothofagi CBS 11611 TaxID=1266666 RepID=A0A1G4IY81_9SACH|nr:LANO_0B05292g1_1 [Lachancea nothofagi CBS 11611]
MAKKKTLKQQDFQKKKLKVGKAKQPASNVTDTSFTARMISLPNQAKIRSAGDGISSNHRNLELDVIKRLSLCKHHSAVTRKETLIYFKQITPKIIYTKCVTPMLSSCLPLICDDDSQVRSALLELFEEIGQHDENVLRLHSRALVLFINSGMTHIAPAIQRDSGKFLKCALRYCGDELVRNSWVKMLKGMFGVLGWSTEASKGPKGAKSVSMGMKTSSVVSMNSAKFKKAQQVNLETLLDFVKCGCIEPAMDPVQAAQQGSTAYNKYLIPAVPQPYQHLKLFVKELKNDKDTKGSKLEELNNATFQDFSARREALVEHFYDPMLLNVTNLIADGGECGRTANSLKDTLESIMQLQEA